jgi:HEAT repeat protein
VIVLVAAALIAALIVIVAAFGLFRLRRTPQIASNVGDDLSAQFDNLSEAQRCDFIFALAALDDASSVRLLEHALDDPCEPVALAAAHALAGAGKTAILQRFLDRPGPRAQRIAQSLELLA